MASTSSQRKNRLSASLKIRTGSFSQVLAVSQEAINNNLKALYNLNPELQCIKITLRSGELGAVMNPPKVVFLVDSSSSMTVLYHCFFEPGKGKVWDDNAEYKDFSSIQAKT